MIKTIIAITCLLSAISISLAQEDSQNLGDETTLAVRSKPLVEASTKSLLASGDYNGKVVCSVNDALYTAAGLEWPWDNVIQIYSIKDGRMREEFYTVSRRRDDFSFDPRWLNQKELIFKIGDPVSSYGIYDLVLWNYSNKRLQVADKNLFSRSFSLSAENRFIAFIQGGRILPVGPPVSSPSLAVFDTQQKITRTLPPSLPNLSGRGWTSQNKLLYTERQTSSDEQNKSARPMKSSIREFDPSNGSSHLFIRNAFTPFVSPDGNRIAYFVFDNPFPEEKENKIRPDPTLPSPASPIYLVLANAKGEPINLIAQKSWDYPPTLRWFANGKKIVIYERRRRKVTIEGRDMEGAVSIYDLEEKSLKKVGNLRYFAPTGMETNDDELLCRPIELTKDGRFLLFEIQQSSQNNLGTTLTAFDLKDGTNEDWFFISAFQGLDWIED